MAYEVFEGNRADVATVEDMVELMENYYGVTDRIWVLDRGIVSEENLDYLCEKKAPYPAGNAIPHNAGTEEIDNGDGTVTVRVTTTVDTSKIGRKYARLQVEL